MTKPAVGGVAGHSVLARAVASVCLAVLWLGGAPSADAQVLGGRGFVDARGALFPQDAPQDDVNIVGDVLVRAEGFMKPSPSVQFAAGLDVRGNTHDQVDGTFGVEVGDRGLRRRAMTLRRLSATITKGPVTVDVGKQFVRWGKTDIVTPTDRLAPRDFIDVLTPEFLPVTGARVVVQSGRNTIDAAWLPWFTPSRMPLLDQRWTPTSTVPPGVRIESAGAAFPSRSQAGLRWSRMADRFEYSLSFFDGVNNAPTLVPAAQPGVPLAVGVVPTIRLERQYRALRSYGADVAVPTPWFTLKSEAALFTAPHGDTDEFVLYVLQAERQIGEWLLIGGYAGEAVTAERGVPMFMPERGMTRSVIGKASLTIDARRSVSAEAALRQDGAGVYLKGEASETYGQHWRATVAAVLLRGGQTDFIGQFQRNSHVLTSVRYSF